MMHISNKFSKLGNSTKMKRAAGLTHFLFVYNGLCRCLRSANFMMRDQQPILILVVRRTPELLTRVNGSTAIYGPL